MFKFNLYVFSLCVALPLLAQAGRLVDNSKFDEVTEACKAETGVDIDDVDLDDPEKEPDEKQSCFVKCMYGKIGLMNDKGKFDADKLIEAIKEDIKDSNTSPELNEESEEKLRKALQKCSEITDSNACLQAGKQTICFSVLQRSKEL